jgi:hypothetical protein
VLALGSMLSVLALGSMLSVLALRSMLWETNHSFSR